MKVWILMANDVEGNYIEALFASKKLAQAANKSPYHIWSYIEEWDVHDDLKQFREGQPY